MRKYLESAMSMEEAKNMDLSLPEWLESRGFDMSKHIYKHVDYDDQIILYKQEIEGV